MIPTSPNQLGLLYHEETKTWKPPLKQVESARSRITEYVALTAGKELRILHAGEYRLYGNRQGHYPVKTDVLGDFTRDNLVLENSQGIKEFIINSHGQWDNIDQCINETKNRTSEKRISFLNTTNINQVLSKNYYDLDLWTCLNGYNLSSDNLIHEAMANGLCMSALASSCGLGLMIRRVFSSSILGSFKGYLNSAQAPEKCGGRQEVKLLR